MTGKEYQELAMRTNDGGCLHRLADAIDREFENKHNPIIADLLNGTIGLCGESGEVADIVKKSVFSEHPLDVDEIKKELGDVMWYVAMCCNSLKISLDDVMQGNIDKLMKRYPEGFSTEASINREV